jgi:hypothetical protein
MGQVRLVRSTLEAVDGELDPPRSPRITKDFQVAGELAVYNGRAKLFRKAMAVNGLSIGGGESLRRGTIGT